MLRINVNTAEAVVTETELITAGRRGLKCAFSFSSDWDGLSKVAVFQGVVTRDVALLTSNEITVPAECIAKAQFPLKIGVYGANGDGTIAIPTIWCSFGKVLPSATRSNVPPDELTPDIVAQIQSAAANALWIAQQIQTQADSGAFDGFSPTISVERIQGGWTVLITNENGSLAIPVMDGAKGEPGSGIWLVNANYVFGQYAMAISNLEGRADATPAVDDLVIASDWNVYIIRGVYGSSVGCDLIGSIKGETGPQGPRGYTGDPGPAGVRGSLIWSSTALVEQGSGSSWAVPTSSLTGKSGATPLYGDLVIASEPGNSGAATYLYNIVEEGSTDVFMDAIGSVKGGKGDTGDTGQTGATGPAGTSIWRVDASHVVGQYAIATQYLEGREGTAPAIDDLVIDSNWNVYVLKFVSASSVGGDLVGNIKGETGATGQTGPQGIPGQPGDDGSVIWTSTSLVEAASSSDWRVLTSSLSGPSGKTPKSGDLLIGPVPGASGTPTYLYSIYSVGSGSYSYLFAVGSIKGEPGDGTGAFLVTITYDSGNDAYVSNKSFAEIKAAHQAGKTVTVVYDGAVTDEYYSLGTFVDDDPLEFMVFSRSAEGITDLIMIDNQGTVDKSETKPSYTASEVGAAPAVQEVTVSTAGAVTQALEAGKIYHFTGALTALTITLTAAPSGQPAQYHFDFNCGSTAPTVTLPSTVVLPDGNSFDANKHYEVDILNIYGAVISWAIS